MTLADYAQADARFIADLIDVRVGLDQRAAREQRIAQERGRRG